MKLNLTSTHRNCPGHCLHRQRESKEQSTLFAFHRPLLVCFPKKGPGISNSANRPKESQWLFNYETLLSTYKLIHGLMWCQAEANKG